MTDIITRLTSPDEATDENICTLLDDAAAEIERLRKELEYRSIVANELYDACGSHAWDYTEWLDFGQEHPWLEGSECDE